MKYRPEIDGLRALAVLPVIFFHADFMLFSGGFIGVDIFFVISGYLITTLLISDIEGNSFSIINFYERRARRLLPALFFVMLLCIPFAWLWMLPTQMKDFSQSLLAVSFFISNVLFWKESGYFGEDAAEKPLLHTWSLSVEEQYYLLFPIFLLIAWRFGKSKVFWSIVLLALVSLLISEWGWRNKAIANFYLAPPRAWEILTGSIAAFIVKKRGIQKNNSLSLFGLILIFASIFIYDEQTPFPSIYSLLPITGVLLVILYANSSTIVAKFLSTKVLVGTGLISYSAYLWHQPLFAFARIRLHQPNELIFLILSILSLLFAFLSWKFIEQPFRGPNPIIKKQSSVFLFSTLGILLFSFLGLIGHFSNGFSEFTKERENLYHLAMRGEINTGIDDLCDGLIDLSQECSNSDEPKLLLWGDSYAMHLYQGLSSSNPSLKIKQHTKSVCSPILDISVLDPKGARGYVWATKCIEFNQAIFEWLEKNKSIEFVILSSPFEWISKHTVLVKNGTVKNSNFDFVVNSFSQTIKKLRDLGVGVVLVSPTPKHRIDIGKCLEQKTRFKMDINCNFSLNKNLNFEFIEAMQEYVNVYWIHEDICRDGICYSENENKFIFRDYSHLSKEGSHVLGKKNDWYFRMRNLALDDSRFFQKENDSTN